MILFLYSSGMICQTMPHCLRSKWAFCIIVCAEKVIRKLLKVSKVLSILVLDTTKLIRKLLNVSKYCIIKLLAKLNQ